MMEVSNEQIYKMLDMMNQAIGELTKDVKEIKEELQDHKFRLERIENKLDQTTQTTDSLATDMYKIKSGISILK